MPYTAFSGTSGDVGALNTMLTELFAGVQVADGITAQHWKATTGGLRLLPYADATNGAMFESKNAAETVNLPLTLKGLPLRLLGSNGQGAYVDSNGNFLVGNSTPTFANTRFDLVAAAANNGIGSKVLGNASYAYLAWNADTAGNNLLIGFLTESTATFRGSISYNRTGGLVAYNTTSDYRAKDLYGPLTDTGTVIDAIPVYRGKMHGATVERPMMVAHEVQAHAPYAVTGEKDDVHEDGAPLLQQMDASALVPLLWAEVQDLRRRLAAAGIA